MVIKTTQITQGGNTNHARERDQLLFTHKYVMPAKYVPVTALNIRYVIGNRI